jgi:flagellar basal-body rod protein FlgB
MKPESVDFLRAGLKAVSLRQSVTANNIANLNTAGFRRGEVRFESLLADAVKNDSVADPADVAPQVLSAASEDPADPGNNVDLDVEVGDLIKNSTMQKAYLRLMTKLMKQLELAIQD